MVSLHASIAALWILICRWTLEFAAGCETPEIDGRCCNLCPPGTHLKEFCTDTNQTVCSPCPSGFFSQQPNSFDRCTKCVLCQGDHQEQEETCSPIANAKCSCSPGFLCSNKVCSECQENKCAVGEKAVKKWSATDSMLYECKQACPDQEYFDVETNICIARTQCSKKGLVEQFPGNNTHDSVCLDHGTYALCVTVGIACALLSLILLAILSIVCKKKYKAAEAAVDSPVKLPSLCEYHLSQEESGMHLQTDSDKSPLQKIVIEMNEFRTSSD
ncbi:tumor necrosis factor receptor superfamily member 5-like [Entelurus aequoreus]|uniref:tumor necrosis factor receptor superfamily member 5-like n=1 Tax=Entelurus aequoreus TaxID=161455 RepID=UPI002B1D1E00|nr:tumor necrosis factor receptor superfamily member 5-like [Entelurus aequoreus]